MHFCVRTPISYQAQNTFCKQKHKNLSCNQIDMNLIHHFVTVTPANVTSVFQYKCKFINDFICCFITILLCLHEIENKFTWHTFKIRHCIGNYIKCLLVKRDGQSFMQMTVLFKCILQVVCHNMGFHCI